MSKLFYVSHHGQAMELPVLENMFTTVGDVESFQRATHPVYNTRAFYVVEMATSQQASDCVERFNGQQAVDRTLSVTSQLPMVVLQKPGKKHGK